MTLIASGMFVGFVVGFLAAALGARTLVYQELQKASKWQADALEALSHLRGTQAKFQSLLERAQNGELKFGMEEDMEDPEG